MKKLFLLLALGSMISPLAIAYSSTDLVNANVLAREKIINDHTADPARYNLDKNISRYEVLVVALRVKWVTVPETYTCKGYYSDVKKTGTTCVTIETAADLGLVTRANAKFRPSDSITRAEALKIVVNASGLETNPDNYTDNWLKDSGFSDWQTELLSSLTDCRIYNRGVSCEDGKDINTAMENFKPNVRALRSEVFDFLMYTPMIQLAQQKVCDDILEKLLSNDVSLDETLVWLDKLIDMCSSV